MFASATIVAHLVRGVIAAALIVWALDQATDPAFSVAAAVAAVIAMRGCPLCWILGLFETITETTRSHS